MAPKKGTTRKRKELAPLDFSVIKTGVVPPQDMSRQRPTRGTRDSDQKQVDAIVQTAYDEWRNAGQPESWDDTPGTFLYVPDPALDVVKARLLRAGTLYKLDITFGSVVSEDGYSQLVFTATKPTPEMLAERERKRAERAAAKAAAKAEAESGS